MTIHRWWIGPCFHRRVRSNNHQPGRSRAQSMSRSPDAMCQDAVWAAIEPLIPPPPPHPLGCHRPRVSDRLCFRGRVLIRLTTGSSWQDIEAILDFGVSDTTSCSRPAATSGSQPVCLDELHTEAVAVVRPAIIDARPERSVDRRQSAQGALRRLRAPGRTRQTRAKLGWKWCDRRRTSRRPAGLGNRRREPQRRQTPRPNDRVNPAAGSLDDVDTMHLDARLRLPKDPTRKLNDAGLQRIWSSNAAVETHGTRRQAGCRCGSVAAELGAAASRGWVGYRWLSRPTPSQHATEQTCDDRHAAGCCLLPSRSSSSSSSWPMAPPVDGHHSLPIRRSPKCSS